MSRQRGQCQAPTLSCLLIFHSSLSEGLFFPGKLRRGKGLPSSPRKNCAIPLAPKGPESKLVSYPVRANPVLLNCLPNAHKGLLEPGGIEHWHPDCLGTVIIIIIIELYENASRSLWKAGIKVILVKKRNTLKSMHSFLKIHISMNLWRPLDKSIYHYKNYQITPKM